MKKKAVLIISILLVICIGIISFSGCFLFMHPRHKTLKLTQVYQLVDGDIVFDIGNIDEIEDDDKIQYTLDNGKTWRDAKFNWSDNCYYCGVDESDYGKEFKIAVRIAEDDENRASRKSNRISYVVKAPNGINEINIGGLWINRWMEDYIDEYIFVFEGNKIQLKKFYQQENGEIVLKAVEDKEKLEFEYKLIDKSVVLKQTPDFIKSGGEWLREYFNSEEEYLCALETIAYFWCYSEESLKPYDTENWIDYDYSKGISEEEFSENIVADFYEDGDSIMLGEQVFLLVRVKENSVTLRSQTFVLSVPLQ